MPLEIGVQFEKLVLLFGIYSCLGWVLECIYCSIKNQRLINRGFLNGLWCPIYGFGAVALATILSPLKDQYWAFIPLAILVTTLIELVTGWVFERVLHLRLWDYSHRPFQFKGYICLEFSILWGVLSACFVWFIHPFFQRQVDKIPEGWYFPLSAALIVVMSIDFVLSAVSAVKMSERLAAFEKLSAWSEQAEALKARLEAQRQEFLRKYRHRLRSHPTLTSRAYPEALSHLKALSLRAKEKRKKPEDPKS